MFALHGLNRAAGPDLSTARRQGRDDAKLSTNDTSEVAFVLARSFLSLRLYLGGLPSGAKEKARTLLRTNLAMQRVQAPHTQWELGVMEEALHVCVVQMRPGYPKSVLRFWRVEASGVQKLRRVNLFKLVDFLELKVHMSLPKPSFKASCLEVGNNFNWLGLFALRTMQGFGPWGKPSPASLEFSL